MSFKNKAVVTALLGSMAAPAWAAPTMPKNPGWSGFLQLSYSYNGIENNEVAGIGIGNYTEFTNESIDSIFDSPDGVTEALPGFGYQLGYMFESRTYMYLGRELVDEGAHGQRVAVGAEVIRTQCIGDDEH